MRLCLSTNALSQCSSCLALGGRLAGPPTAFIQHICIWFLIGMSHRRSSAAPWTSLSVLVVSLTFCAVLCGQALEDSDCDQVELQKLVLPKH